MKVMGEQTAQRTVTYLEDTSGQRMTHAQNCQNLSGFRTKHKTQSLYIRRIMGIPYNAREIKVF
jgi:hypothetical protein